MSESSDIQAAGQHYLVCGTEDCKKNGQFYCNDCYQPMSEQCRHEHLNSPDTKTHGVVLYRQRKHQLPVKKCKLHPTRNVDIFCEECSISLCSKCATMKEHKNHTFKDLEDIYAEQFTLWQREFSKIQKYFLPTSKDLKTEIEVDATEIKNIMESIRTSMKSEAEALKNLVDDVTSENIQHTTHTIEKSLLEMLKSQETTYVDYTVYLEKMSDEFQEYLSLTSQKLLFCERLKIHTIPETTKSIPPVFTAGQFNKDDVSKLLGRVSFSNTEPEKRNIKPMESVSTEMKQTLSLSSSVNEVREYGIQGIVAPWHVSVDKSGRIWVSNQHGHLFQTDLQGNRLQKLQASDGGGFHTVTQDEDLIYIDKDKKIIYKITPDKKIPEFIKTGDWEPLSIHSSRINGDILVGMKKNREAKVTRYNKAGQEIQNIQRDNEGQELYEYPHSITENVNGDICTSDRDKLAVVVVNKSGQHRFSYTGQGSKFCPYGSCTDVLGHILVSDYRSNTINLLNRDGGFLSNILPDQEEIMYPRGLCVDDENNLYVARVANTLPVYKYLQ